MKLTFRYALLELLNNRFFSFLFIFNLTLGLLGFIILGNAQISVKSYFDENLRKIFNGDFEVSSRQVLPDNILDQIGDITAGKTTSSRNLGTVSMIAGEVDSNLFSVKAIDDKYPLYGDFFIDNQRVDGSRIRSELEQDYGIWLSESGMDLIGAAVGDTVKLGKLNFTVKGIITKDPGLASGFSQMVQPAYVSLNHIRETGLIDMGSRLDDELIFAADPGYDYNSLADSVQERINELYGENSEIRIRRLDQASDRLGRIINYVSGFLGLISLVALFLAGIGTGFLFYGYAKKRMKFTAIAMCFGLRNRQSYSIVILQLAILVTASFSLAVFLGGIAGYLTESIIGQFTDGIETSKFNWVVAFQGFLVALFSSVFFTAPSFLSVRNIKPVTLLKEDNNHSHEPTSKNILLGITYLAGLLFFYSLAVFLSGWFIGSIFIGILIGTVAVIALLCKILLILADRFSDSFGSMARIALRNISRNSGSTLSCVTAISLGVFLISVIPQISQGIRDELQSPSTSVLPDFFLIDIQSEQLEPLEALIEGEGYQLNYLSPMIRGRLEGVNGEKISTWEENNCENNEGSRRRRRGFNLTYQEDLKPSEKLIAGRWFEGQYTDFDKPAEISLEEGYANRCGLKLGDIMSFNIQSVPIEGKVVNFREVKWNSFQPNFFVTFQPGAIDQAPKTFIGNVNGIPVEKKTEIRKKIVKEFPNISPIDINEVVSKFLDIGEKAAQAVAFVALLSIFSGLLVVFSVSVSQTREKRKELSLLKVMGAKGSGLRKYLLIEFVTPGIFASLIGISLSIIAAVIFSSVLFDNLHSLNLLSLGAILASGAVILVVLALFVSAGITSAKPLEELRTE